jgi:hypothetical protein
MVWTRRSLPRWKALAEAHHVPGDEAMPGRVLFVQLSHCEAFSCVAAEAGRCTPALRSPLAHRHFRHQPLAPTRCPRSCPSPTITMQPIPCCVSSFAIPSSDLFAVEVTTPLPLNFRMVAAFIVLLLPQRHFVAHAERACILILNVLQVQRIDGHQFDRGSRRRRHEDGSLVRIVIEGNRPQTRGMESTLRLQRHSNAPSPPHPRRAPFAT